MRHASSSRHVALLIETSNRYGRDLLDGVRAYVREREGWALQLSEQGRGNAPPTWLRNWQGDGIIARVENRQIATAVRRLKLPAVNVSAGGLFPSGVSVIADSASVTRLAAEHLLERGLTHFGFFGDHRYPWSSTHCRNFQRRIKPAGFDCSAFPPTKVNLRTLEAERRAITSWLLALPRPVGIMACNDIRAHELLEVCRELRLAVPDEVAVIGWHDDKLLCELCEPSLTSVIPNARRTGYEAAELLDAMLRGQRVRPGVRTVEPLGVAVRQSTDVLALADRQIAAAVRFIRDHACEGITVAEAARAASLSRSTLERGFRKLLRSTPHDEILRTQLARAKHLLSHTDFPLRIIAQRIGFQHPEYLSAVFKKHVNLTPTEYRRASQP